MTGLLRKNANGGVTLVPRAMAQAVMRSEEQEYALAREVAASASQGQQAGPPGMGPAPGLVHAPGGDLVAGLQHPAFTTFERLRRKLPEEGWFNPLVGPDRPVQFQIEAFEVPPNQELWLFDYQFSVFRPSGVDPGDFVQAEDGRFSNQIGFDINVGGTRQGNLSYQLDPDAVTAGRAAFDPPIGAPPRRGVITTRFDSSAANSFAAATNIGTSLLPARRQVQGAEGHPFTFVIGQGSKVSLNCVIFNTIVSPIAAIEGRMAGYLIHTQVSRALLNRVRPR